MECKIELIQRPAEYPADSDYTDDMMQEELFRKKHGSKKVVTRLHLRSSSSISSVSARRG